MSDEGVVRPPVHPSCCCFVCRRAVMRAYRWCAIGGAASALRQRAQVYAGAAARARAPMRRSARWRHARCGDTARKSALRYDIIMKMRDAAQKARGAPLLRHVAAPAMFARRCGDAKQQKPARVPLYGGAVARRVARRRAAYAARGRSPAHARARAKTMRYPVRRARRATRL